MSRKTPLVFAGALVWAFSALSAFAQTAVVQRNANLRPDPSTNQDPIRLLHPPEKLNVLDPTSQNRYLHVRTSANEEGWVWMANVRVEAAPESDTTGGQVSDSISPDWDKPEPTSTDFTAEGITCGPTGDGGDSITNARKDRTDVPTAYHLVSFQAIDGLAFPVAPKSRMSWSQNQLSQIAPFEGAAVALTAYLDRVKVEGPESCNCHMKQRPDVDWHMWVTAHQGEFKKDAIVVETTPRIRKDHLNWTTAALKPFVQSENEVRISGWLMFDPEHREQLGKFRNTLWEIHPITRIEVFKDGGWVDLDATP